MDLLLGIFLNAMFDNLFESLGNAVERHAGPLAGDLDPLFSGRERTLQRLSATFRRADLIDMLQ